MHALSYSPFVRKDHQGTPRRDHPTTPKFDSVLPKGSPVLPKGSPAFAARLAPWRCRKRLLYPRGLPPPARARVIDRPEATKPRQKNWDCFQLWPWSWELLLLFFHVAGKINLNCEGDLKTAHLLLSLYIVLRNFLRRMASKTHCYV
jgi:hypothetical protein